MSLYFELILTQITTSAVTWIRNNPRAIVALCAKTAAYFRQRHIWLIFLYGFVSGTDGLHNVTQVFIVSRIAWTTTEALFVSTRDNFACVPVGSVFWNGQFNHVSWGSKNENGGFICISMQMCSLILSTFILKVVGINYCTHGFILLH